LPVSLDYSGVGCARRRVGPSTRPWSAASSACDSSYSPYARGSTSPGCPGDAFFWIGADDGGWSYVYSDHTGHQAEVLLLNGARTGTVAAGDHKAEATARRLNCGP